MWSITESWKASLRNNDVAKGVINSIHGTTESYSQEVGDSTWARDDSRHLGTLAIGSRDILSLKLEGFKDPKSLEMFIPY